MLSVVYSRGVLDEIFCYMHINDILFVGRNQCICEFIGL